LVYVLVAVLAFGLAAGVGAMAALMLSGDPEPSQREEPRPLEEQRGGSPGQQQQEVVAEREAGSRQSEAGYVGEIGDIQGEAVEAFLNSHDRLSRYDALTSDDLEEMRANETTLRTLSSQVESLDPPQGYEEQYRVFDSAIAELSQAVQVAYDVVADPTTATKADFDAYDQHVQEAAERLRRSNELLDRDYRTIEGVQEISPL
jgi:hypothetical protein